MRIFIENLAPETTGIALRQIFSLHGRIDSCELSVDEGATQHKGTAYLEMPNEAEARTAIKELNHTSLNERQLTISEAASHGDSL